MTGRAVLVVTLRKRLETSSLGRRWREERGRFGSVWWEVLQIVFSAEGEETEVTCHRLRIESRRRFGHAKFSDPSFVVRVRVTSSSEPMSIARYHSVNPAFGVRVPRWTA